MITSLSIRNYALIEELSVELGPGLTIITGETGAGKSIIVDAFGLILGERASADSIRTGATKAVVEGTFAPPAHLRMDEFLEAQGIDVQETLILRREIAAGGQSRCFVNDTPVPLSALKQVGDLLVDFHGQHEHQSLLRRQTHGDLLDAYAGLQPAVADYRGTYLRLREQSKRLTDLLQREKDSRERQDLYEFQLKEIDAVGPRADEESELLNEVRILEHAEQLSAAASELYEALYEGTSSAYEILCRARDRLASLSSIDNRFEEVSAEGASAATIVAELARFLRQYTSEVEFNPERLEELRDRLGRLSMLKKKFGGSIEMVLAHREKIMLDLDALRHFQSTRATLEEERSLLQKQCVDLGGRLSAQRKKASALLETELKKELAALGIPGARVAVAIEPDETENGGAGNDPWDRVRTGAKTVRLNDRGLDRIEFLISLNKGEELRPLAKVASGGEISRIMLAMKGILANNDTVPVVVFDEIDVGVSGRIAQAVGMSLKKLATSHQVIAITHLPQIAGMGDDHCAVTKREEGTRTTTSLHKLNPEERIREVARLLSGATITDAALAGARELMNASHQQSS